MAFTLLLSCAPAYADMSLTIEPLQQTIGIGETAEVNIVLSGLVEDPGLNEFWIEFSYDTAILNFGGGTAGVEADDTSIYEVNKGINFNKAKDLSILLPGHDACEYLYIQ